MLLTNENIRADAEVAWSRASTDMGVAVRQFSDDSPADVISHYADDLAAKGWDTELRQAPGGTLIIADKGNRKAAIAATETEDGRTQIDILVTELPR